MYDVAKLGPHGGANMAIYRNTYNTLKDYSYKIMHTRVWPNPPKISLPTSVKNYNAASQREHGAGLTLCV
jgi:hypothetical protein